jgi:hypothetical protein
MRLRKLCVGTLLVASITIPLLTAWALAAAYANEWRDRVIELAAESGTGPRLWWPPSWREK